MKLAGEQTLLRVYLRNTDKRGWFSPPAVEEIVALARRHDLAGATVLRGICGLDITGQLLESRPWSLVEHVPVIVEIVDTPRVIGRFLSVLTEVMPAGLATLDVIEQEGLVQRSAQLGERSLARMRGWLDRYPLVGDVRGKGLLLGAELVRDRTSRAPASQAAEEVMYQALARGLSFKLTMGSILTLTPALTIGEDELDRALSILEECLDGVTAAGLQ